MAGSLIQMAAQSSPPSVPPSGSFNLFIEGTTVYLQDSAGNLYAFGSTDAITALTGDVTATGPGSVGATVNFVGGQSASAVASAVVAYLAATSSDTPSTLVMRDSSGNFSAGTITANLTGVATNATTAVNFTGSLLGDVTGTQGATAIASNIVTAKLLTGLTSGTNTPITASNTILQGFENLQAQISSSVGAAITSLTGDIIATGPGAAAATVEKIQGTTVSGTTGTGNVVFSASPTLTGTLTAGAANFSGAISASNFSGSSSGTNTGDVTLLNTNSIALSFASGQTNLSANLNLSAASSDVGYIPALSQIKSDGLLVEVLAGIPVTIGTSNNIGSAASAARSDHVHAITSSVVLALLLTGYAPGTNTPITASNTILQGFENLQAQIDATTGAAITALTGDVSATGPGSAPATVNSVGGKSASAIATSVTATQAATPSDTPSTIVERDSSGNFSAGTITANLSGNATTSTTSTNFTGTLVGDVTGTQGATVVSKVDGFTAAAVGTSVTATQAATPSDTPSTIVERDGSGNFSAGVVTASLSGNATTATTATTATNFTGSLAGDVTGTQPATSVVAIQGVPVSSTAPTDAQLLVYNSGTSKWTPQSLTGDVLVTDVGVTTIQPNVITNAKLAQMATLTLKGNNTGVTANASDLTVAQVNTMLGDVTTVGAIDSNGAVANGLSINGNSLFAQSASATVPGMVNLTTQSFSGNKTFAGTVAISPSSTSALVVNTTSFILDSVNNALGIGVQPATSVMIDGINTTGASKLVQMTGYGANSTTGYRGRFARGTVTSPSAVQSGDILNAVSGRGYGASQFAAASTGVVNVVAGETFTNTSNMTYLQFSTTPTGSVTSAEAMRVATTGVTLGPQSASTAKHQINGGVNNTTNTISASTYTVDSMTTDFFVYTNSTSNAITITLPAATNGRTLVIADKAGTAATNHVTISPPGVVTINGANASIAIGANFGGWMLMSDGTNWTAFNFLLPDVPAQPISSTVIDWSSGDMFTKTLSANTTFTFANAQSGQTIVIRLTNTASNFTVTWPTIKWPVQTSPVMTTGAFSDVYTILFDGTSYYGSYVQNF